MTVPPGRYLCLHCQNHILRWDVDSEEYACPGPCARRFQPEWINRQGALTTKGPPMPRGSIRLQPASADSIVTGRPAARPGDMRELESPVEVECLLAQVVRVRRRARVRGAAQAKSRCEVPGLAQVRVRLNWTQEELSERIGVQHDVVRKWESGYRTPSIPSLKRLAEILKTNEITLLHGIGESPRLCAAR